MAVALVSPAVALAQQTHLGMDRNDYPGDTAMKGMRQQAFAFTGYWLNNPPGERVNTWKGHRKSLQATGYGFLLLFNGREYVQLKGRDAERIGRTDAAAALQAAQREGFPNGAIIFLDQEQGGRMLPEQRAYIHAWSDAVVRGGYRAGVYCSGIAFRESADVSVVTANDIRDNAAGRELHFFVSNDQCPPSPGCTLPRPLPAPAKSGVSFADVWQYAQSPGREAMIGACRRSYSRDGDCYPPGDSSTYIDIDVATSADPSHGRDH